MCGYGLRRLNELGFINGVVQRKKGWMMMVIGAYGLVIIMANVLWEERGEERKILDEFELRKRRSCL